jgi:hypothetical protein
MNAQLDAEEAAQVREKLNEWKSLRLLTVTLKIYDNPSVLAREEFKRRLYEAIRVDLINAKWVSQEIRSNYLSAIIRGKIKIGS